MVKFLSNPQGLRILPNEWWAYRLGSSLGLPIVKSEKVYLPEELIGLPQFAEFQLQAGPHYGSRYLVEHTLCTTMEKVARCVNLDLVPLMIAFDYWINNNDRYASNRNLLIEKGEVWQLRMIDHGSCFCGAGWTVKTLNANAERVQPYWGELYQRLVSFVDDKQMFEEAIARLEALPDCQIADAIQSDVPEEWAVTPEEKEALVHFLLTRKPFVRAAIHSVIPLMKGGQG